MQSSFTLLSKPRRCHWLLALIMVFGRSTCWKRFPRSLSICCLCGQHWLPLSWPVIPHFYLAKSPSIIMSQMLSFISLSPSRATGLFFFIQMMKDDLKWVSWWTARWFNWSWTMDTHELSMNLGGTIRRWKGSFDSLTCVGNYYV